MRVQGRCKNDPATANRTRHYLMHIMHARRWINSLITFGWLEVAVAYLCWRRASPMEEQDVASPSCWRLLVPNIHSSYISLSHTLQLVFPTSLRTFPKITRLHRFQITNFQTSKFDSCILLSRWPQQFSQLCKGSPLTAR